MIRHLLTLLVTLAVLAPPPVSATALTMPSRARLLGDRVSPMDSYALPLGPLAAGRVGVRDFEGRVERQSWRIDGVVDTTLQVLAPLREQIRGAGFDILFECRDLACGGFDFRFAIEVIAAPDMHVNIRDYRFLAATRGEDEALSLLVSRTGNSVYIQVIHASSSPQAHLNITPQDQSGNSQALPNLLAQELEAQGHIALGDLVFETGAAQLGDGPFVSLERLAAFLAANPSYRIALVGHTDSVGSLKVNIALSKRRAKAVRARLTGKYAIDPARIEAEGMGYLAPIASNLTPEGREANRRVEAILLSD